MELAFVATNQMARLSMPKLKELFNKTLSQKIMKELNLKNVMEVPSIKKITLNMGVGAGATDRKIVDNAAKDLTLIAGQKAVITKARKSEAAFKIREGWPIGTKVTLRGDRMYEFLERLISIAIPRIRDFRGFSPKAFDKQGNYNLGIKEQIVFPEIRYDKVDALRGLDICITTSARTKEEGLALLKAFNFPLKEN